MANQPPSRPWFRLGTLARPYQPPAPTSTPAPRAPTQPPAAPLSRSTMFRPAFRPPAPTQPQPAQQPVPPPQPLRGPPPTPSETAPQPASAAVASKPSAPTPVSPLSPPQPRPIVGTTPVPTPLASPVTQKSPSASKTSPQSRALPSPSTTPASAAPATPVSQKSPQATRVSPVSTPLRSPSTTPAPAAPISPITPKSPPAPKVSPKTLPLPSSLPASPKPKLQSPPPSMLSSPALKQVVARALPTSPPPPTSERSLPSPLKTSPPSPSTKPLFRSPLPESYSPSSKQITSPLVPTSPPKPSNGLVTNSRGPSGAAQLPASPRADKPLPETPPQSPKIKSALPSPPAFSLPPSLAEHERKILAVAEQKTMLQLGENVAKPGVFHDSYGTDSRNPRIGIHAKPEKHTHNKSSDSEEKGMRVITITGENRGAIMELGYSPRTRGNPHGYSIRSQYHKLKSNGELSEDTLSGLEGRSKIQDKVHNARRNDSAPMRAFMNSNVQGINSSIVFNSTCSHHDPGVHLSVVGKPFNSHGHARQREDHANGKNVHKDDKNKFSN